MAPWKFSGSDGFPVGFFQNSWSVMDNKVCNYVKDLWRHMRNIIDVNQTDLCLIPKVINPYLVTQFFCHLSLCNIIYKLLSICIVHRLQKAIDKMVYPYQTGFIVDRSVQDNIIVAREVLHSMNRLKGKHGYFVMKIDLAKTYNELEFCS